MSKSADAARSDRPNLEQKKKLAKELLKATRRLDGEQAARFTWNLSRFLGKSAQDVLREGVTLVDAQHVIARESGFESWPKLTGYIRELDSDPDGPIALFEDAVRAMIRGDCARLTRLLTDHPEVATMHSPRHHRAYLPHYLAANGVEDEHQITPPNAVEVARILFEHGGAEVVDAKAGFYDGGGGSTPLVGLVTSGHPHNAGVQADLVHVFLDSGAAVNGIDDDCLPLASALGFRYPLAATALAERGARIDNLPAAAGLGRIDLVEQYLDESAGLTSCACTFPNPGYITFSESAAPHPDATRQQALVFACMGGHVRVAELLLRLDVDINGGPRRGITALHEASYQGALEVVRILLDGGADPTLRDEMWESTSIGWADGGKQIAVIEEILARGQVDILDAVELAQFEMVRQMLQDDPSLANAPEGKGGALRYAAFHGNIELAQLLLEFDADPALHSEAGITALDYAEKSGNDAMTKLIRAAVQKTTNPQNDEVS